MGRGQIISIQTTSERGGAEYANVDLLNALLERGHNTTLVTNMPELALGTRVCVRELDIGPKLGRASAVRVMLEAPRTLLRLVRALRAERPIAALLVSFKKEQLLCSLLPRKLTGEIVWVEWGPVPAPMRHGLGRLFYALAARRARHVLAVSEGTAETVVEAGVTPRKVTVMADLVNLHRVEFDGDARARTRRSWGVGENTLVMGCVSRFQKRKRNDVLIDAMAHLDGDVLLVLAGEGEEEQALRVRAAPYGERVRFVPNVRGHVEEFLSACDLLAFAPSPTEADRPRVTVMAQLVGLPILATDSEGTEVLSEPGVGTIVSPHNDPLAYAAAAAIYRDDPQLRRHQGATARRRILESYNPDETLRTVEETLGLHR